LIEEASKGVPIRKIVLGRHDSFLKPSSKSLSKSESLSNNLNHDFEAEIKETSLEILKSADGIGLSGFGEISDEVVQIITETCTLRGKISAIHAAEYEEVQRNSLNLTGKTEIERALKTGFDILIHVTSPLNSDLDLLKDKEVSVVCCPRSNGALSVGIPPIKEMWDERINLLLGTDNLMFNSPNMFREMEYTLKVTRGYYKEYFPPVEILKMATVNAGLAFNINTGCIEEGKLADIMVVEQLSKDPVLSLINRTEPEHIKSVINEGIQFEK